eukprot:TRINITY_DN2760_c0_g1_i2.p1 TRINITY_DN2760_c0_g1~~TRINITY_DN2760_c0_g1_i2.p1  ORF type:complete len:260 (-),score=42.73 TRINITY_DN2760_c0_g1_i2:38-817(-)
MASGGITAAVDLGSPYSYLQDRFSRNYGMQILCSGPMVTAVGGYPTQSWGSNGFGAECTSVQNCTATVEKLYRLGASVIKIPFMDPFLNQDILEKVIQRAHELGLKVAAHATDDFTAYLAGIVGADVLAHTPIGLSEKTFALWSKRAVISTLSAFGGTETITNFLKRYNVTVLYGTDFGNSRIAGISRSELEYLQFTGMSNLEIINSATLVPSKYWNMTDYGTLAVGKKASFLVLPRDPLKDLFVLTTPEAVFINGVRN